MKPIGYELRKAYPQIAAPQSAVPWSCCVIRKPLGGAARCQTWKATDEFTGNKRARNADISRNAAEVALQASHSRRRMVARYLHAGDNAAASACFPKASRDITPAIRRRNFAVRTRDLATTPFVMTASIRFPRVARVRFPFDCRLEFLEEKRSTSTGFRV
jgi:hypothetical protein